MKTALIQLRQLLSGREQKQVILLFVLMIVGAALEMIGVGAIPAFIALLSDPQRVQRAPLGSFLLSRIPTSDPAKIALIAAAVLLVLFLIKNTYLSILSFVQARFVTNRQVKLASRLFESYLAAPYPFHLQRNSAELLRNANNEALDVIGSVLVPFLTLSMEALTIAAILSLLLIAEPFVSLVGFVLLGGASFVSIRIVRRRLIEYGAAIQNSRLNMIKIVNEGLGAIKITKSLGRERHFLHQYRSTSDRYAEATRFRQVMLDIPRLYLETAAMAALLVVAAVLITQGRPVAAIIPTLSLLAVAVVRMIPSFNRITTSVTTLRYGLFSLNAVFADLTTGSQHQVTERPEPSRSLPLAHAMELANVWFTYPGAATASLRGVTLRVNRGEAIGIVGPTGSGKTTLIDVVLGLLQPNKGAVLVDNHDIRGQERLWGASIGYVPQDIYLLDDTIRRNIAFGMPNEAIDEAAVLRAVEAAQLSSFVATLPQGLDAIVGERGVRLSGGQRQRIGIARALYHDPSVLMFDEATSSLDHETEKYVMEAVDRLRGERTLIIVAHRLSTVKSCDRLYLLANGSIANSGRYDQLLAEDGQFRRLVAM